MTLTPLLISAELWAEYPLSRYAQEGDTEGFGQQKDPEIDRSPIWAMVYGKYLAFLGKEMFWPNIAVQERFQIAVVNWPDLAADLGKRLDGRAIAGVPVEIVALEEKELAGERRDFTLVFIGGTASEDGASDVENALQRWNRKGDRVALVITDGGAIQGHDVVFQRVSMEGNPGLCISPDLSALRAKALELPPHFLQRPCP